MTNVKISSLMYIPDVVSGIGTIPESMTTPKEVFKSLKSETDINE